MLPYKALRRTLQPWLAVQEYTQLLHGSCQPSISFKTVAGSSRLRQFTTLYKVEHGQGRLVWRQPTGMSLLSPDATGSWQCKRHASSESGAERKTGLRGLVKHSISTLRVDSLTSDDYLDISGLAAALLHFRPPTTDGQNVRLPKAAPTWGELFYVSRRTKADIGTICEAQRFPEGTAGFLYYFQPTPALPHAGEIRFRITGSSDPASFVSGRDLQYTDNPLPFAWSHRGPLSAGHRGLLAGILQIDGLLTSELQQEIAEATLRKKPRKAPSILYALNQPFVLNFQQTAKTLYIMARENNKLMFERVNMFFDKQPLFSGSAVCRFVRKEDVIAIQIVKIFDPVRIIDSTPEVSPEAVPRRGEMLRTPSGKIWHYRVPKGKRARNGRWPLRLLQEYPEATFSI